MNTLSAGSPIAPIGNLQRLGLIAFMPHPALTPWVQCYWVMRQQLPLQAGDAKILYPDGGSSLSFKIDPDGSIDTTFINLQARHSFHLTGQQDVFSVRFYPGGAFGLLSQAASQQTDGTFDISDLGINTLQDIQQQLSRSEHPLTRLSYIERWLLRQLSRVNTTADLIQRSLTLMQQQALSVPALSAAVNLSRRQFERKFLLQTGLTPGQLKILLRVRQARQIITQQPLQSLTSIALNCGFYDQAHFIHQFKQITGQTPGSYQKRKQTEQMSQKYNPA